MQLDEKFIKNYQEVIIGALIIVIALVFGVKQVLGSASKISKTKLEHKKEAIKLKEIKKQVTEAEKTKQKLAAQQSKIKPVFDPKNGAEDSMAAFGGMFEDIIDYVKINGLKLRSVDYFLNPQDDPIFSQMPTLYNVAQVKIFVIGDYTQVEGLMRDLTLYPYFINIAEISISPYEKNRQYLLCYLTLNLYSKKVQGASSIMN